MGNRHRDAARAAAAEPPHAPRALPAAPALVPLDSLLARAGFAAQPHAARRAAAPQLRPAASPHADERPQSLLLSVTIAHCACGATLRTPAPYILVRYAENAHTFHYTATGPAAVAPELLAHLPHERRESHINIPYCEECF